MKLFVFAFFAMTLTASANECWIRGKGDVGGRKNVDVRGQQQNTNTRTWQGCYKQALQAAKQYSLSSAGEFASDYDNVHFFWQFNDGYVVDSHGLVTEYSNSYAQKGDAR